MDITAALPQEILDAIVDFSHQDKGILQTWALVHRVFVPGSRFHLFGELKISPKEATKYSDLLNSEHVTCASETYSLTVYRMPWASIALWLPKMTGLRGLHLLEVKFGRDDRKTAISQTLVTLQLNQCDFGNDISRLEDVLCMSAVSYLSLSFVPISWGQIALFSIPRPYLRLQISDKENAEKDSEFSEDITNIADENSTSLAYTFFEDVRHLTVVNITKQSLLPLGVFLRVLGGNLRELDLTLQPFLKELCPSAENFVEHVNLGWNSNLQRLRLDHLSDPLVPHGGAWIEACLSHIRPHSLHTLEVVVLLCAIKHLKEVRWSDLRTNLPAGLRLLRFFICDSRPVVMTNAEEFIRGQFASWHDGLLHFDNASGLRKKEKQERFVY